ncbi:chemotaxis-specific protein-glutamate methyltransferase CheB [Rhodovulum strictum]|uniref:Protein-glutamate methylesterase/protein-glutamine glutaminase n=1 Tax=Rhodovulum strictum TaxID=58314 RepID=A0A844B949_9RHOB|nr:chemotaxis-specific protein-glutamate methyltransferase CheB [Rhodovulum strictum]MRH22130.1 chemotaxis-specific protein-glutamate methyltransferase CheB [Rhodovulum strictum]
MRVLIVDDSALMRRWLAECLSAEPGIDCATARDGRDALSKIASFDPDVVTLDINMPVMDGLSCLAQIMTEAPRPVIMVSSLTDAGALATFEALELGAVDYIAKPSGTVSHDLRTIFPDLVAKVRAAAGVAPRRRTARAARPSTRASARPATRPAPAQDRPRERAGRAAAPCELVLIGASTGGPSAVEEVLLRLDNGFPAPIVIAQHMPRRFTQVFAERLSRQGEMPVIELSRMTELVPGAAYLAQGDADVQISRRGGHLVAGPVPTDGRFVWTPSVDRMVDSALEAVAADRIVAALLTGMGDDGAAAMTRLRSGGGRTIAQSEATCAVYGMPRALVEAGGANRVVDIDRIAATLIRFVGARTGTSHALRPEYLPR